MTACTPTHRAPSEFCDRWGYVAMSRRMRALWPDAPLMILRLGFGPATIVGPWCDPETRKTLVADGKGATELPDLDWLPFARSAEAGA